MTYTSVFLDEGNSIRVDVRCTDGGGRVLDIEQSGTCSLRVFASLIEHEALRLALAEALGLTAPEQEKAAETVQVAAAG